MALFEYNFCFYHTDVGPKVCSSIRTTLEVQYHLWTRWLTNQRCAMTQGPLTNAIVERSSEVQAGFSSDIVWKYLPMTTDDKG